MTGLLGYQLAKGTGWGNFIMSGRLMGEDGFGTQWTNVNAQMR